MKEVERNYFAKLLKELSQFCEIRVLTHCLLDNHFHLLLEVPQPPPPEQRPDGAKLLEKLRQLSILPCVEHVRQKIEGFQQRQDVQGEAEFLSQYHRRMWDLSVFMKLLKQRFSHWYNRKHQRKGTLWEERFKSLMVEGTAQALTTVAAYIDLNAFRAREVDDPKDYRWSGYGAAMGGEAQAQEGLRRIMSIGQSTPLGVQEALERYRVWLYQVGDEQRAAVGEGGKPVRRCFTAEEVQRELLQKGRLPLWIYLMCRVRYLTDGVALGSREYVEAVFERHRERFGAKRRSGARRMRGLEEVLYTLRDLKKRVFGWERQEADGVG